MDDTVRRPEGCTCCTCDDPFPEEGPLCRACEDILLDTYLAVDADKIPTGKDWAEFARQQG